MKNYEKYQTPEERYKAHKQWCEDGNEIDKTCMGSQECDYCYELWLEMEAENDEEENNG